MLWCWIQTALVVTFVVWSIAWSILLRADLSTVRLYSDHGHLEPSASRLPTVDILSIGSLTRPEHQRAQRQTFGSHAFVRNFYVVTERNDSDSNCADQLTRPQLDQVVDFCHRSTRDNDMARLFLDKFRPKSEPGWLCAQKRPVEALAQLLLQRYQNQTLELPAYLVIVDDDTYVNIPALYTLLESTYPYDVPYAIASCLVGGTAHFTIPYGGFGTILTRAAIVNLLAPMQCHGLDATSMPIAPAQRRDAWRSQLCCRQLARNLLGERYLYRRGMSVVELLNAYSVQQAYTAVSNWKVGFCLHSDHALAYFINLYHVAMPATVGRRVVPHPQAKWPLVTRYGYTCLQPNQCANEKNVCTRDSLICHYITPSQMQTLYESA